MRLIQLAYRWVFRRFPNGWVLRLISFGLLRVVHIPHITEKSVPLVIPGLVSANVVRAAWNGNGLVNVAEPESVSLGFSRFREALISASHRGGMVLDQNSLIIPTLGTPGVPRIYIPNTSVDGVLDQVGAKVLVRVEKSAHELEKGIFGGSKAPHNWFHWVIDTVSTLSFARYLPSEYDDYPILVPEVALERENWKAALDSVSNGRQIKVLDSNSWNRVDDLVALDRVTRSGPASLDGIQLARIAVLEEYLMDYRDRVLSSLRLKGEGPIPGRKVFICRRESNVRRYNQNELVEAAAGEGFEAVFPEDLNLYDSVIKIFSRLSPGLFSTRFDVSRVNRSSLNEKVGRSFANSNCRWGWDDWLQLGQTIA